MRSPFLCFRRTLIVPVVGVVTVLLAASSSAKESSKEEATKGCLSVQVRSPQARRLPWARRFSATEILDLELRVFLPGTLTGEHRVDIRVSTPDHQLYQVLTVPFRAESGAPEEPEGQKRKLADYPLPMKEIEARRVGSGRTRRITVSTLLPVAGTSIVSSSLYGAWSAIAFLDGSLDACAPAVSFVITE
jgi:hypothetical protein